MFDILRIREFANLRIFFDGLRFWKFEGSGKLKNARFSYQDNLSVKILISITGEIRSYKIL